MFWRWLFTLYATVWVLQGARTFTVVTRFFVNDR